MTIKSYICWFICPGTKACNFIDAIILTSSVGFFQEEEEEEVDDSSKDFGRELYILSLSLEGDLVITWQLQEKQMFWLNSSTASSIMACVMPLPLFIYFIEKRLWRRDMPIFTLSHETNTTLVLFYFNIFSGSRLLLSLENDYADIKHGYI